MNAQIAKAEREADLKKQEVLVKEQILAATIQKQADADKYRVEQDALAEQAKRQRSFEGSHSASYFYTKNFQHKEDIRL